MSALAEADFTEYATRGARAGSQLRLVAPLRPLQASRGVFVLALSALLLAGLVGLLVINTSLAQGAFTLTELQQRGKVLFERQQVLEEEIAAFEAPHSIERQARALGMVPNRYPVFLRVPDGKVLGDPRPVPGRRVVATTTVDQPSSETDLWTDPIVVQRQDLQ